VLRQKTGTHKLLIAPLSWLWTFRTKMSYKIFRTLLHQRYRTNHSYHGLSSPHKMHHSNP
jgi:hypothetical protein